MAEWGAMQQLKAAHLVGQQRMDDLAEAATDFDEGRTIDALAVFSRALEFAERDLRRHFDHEERALFPVLARIIGRGGPVGAMEGEHESLWHCIDDFAEALAFAKADGRDRSFLGNIDPSLESKAFEGSKDISRMAKHLVWSLRGHIYREDTMLFPLAEATLDDRAKRQVDASMRTVDWLASRRQG